MAFNITSKERERRLRAMQAIMERQNQVGMSIIGGPIMPAMQIASGQPAAEVAGTSIAAALEIWLFYQYLGESATFVEKEALKKIAVRSMLPGTAIVATVPIGVMSASKIHGDSKVIDKTASLGGVATGSTQKRRMQSLGGL